MFSSSHKADFFPVDLSAHHPPSWPVPLLLYADGAHQRLESHYTSLTHPPYGSPALRAYVCLLAYSRKSSALQLSSVIDIALLRKFFPYNGRNMTI